MIDHKADINQVDSICQTALQLAVNDNKPEMVELLIKNGATQKLMCELGIAPLVSASMSGKINVIEVLLETASDRDISDAISAAKSNRYPKIVDFLAAHQKLRTLDRDKTAHHLSIINNSRDLY